MGGELAVPGLLWAEDFYARVKERVAATGSDKYALVSFDYDNFNFINDLFGYEIGDEVLLRVASRIEGMLFEDEFYAKVHADHFGLWLRAHSNEELIERLHKMTENKGVIAGLLPSHYNLVCSAGIVKINHSAENMHSLLDRVNYARKQAKGNYANNFVFYDEKMGEDLHWRKVITLMIETALQEREFEMYLQPKVLIKTGQVVGAEALVRWNSKEYGMIYPDRFIYILEQNGFIKQLDFYMLEQACSFLKESGERGLPMLPISVNFSRMHVRTTSFVDRVFGIASKYGIPTNLIEIELTENVLSTDFEALVRIVSELKYLGFKVSLDDFGSAYSSLNYLKDLPLDIIKIDKGFLNASENTDRGRIIIAKMVELIKSLRLVSVMEGVEEEEQSEFLQKLGCDLGQGYLYARPLPVDKFIEFLKKTPHLEDIKGYIEGDDEEQKPYQSVIPQEFQMDNWELYTLGKNIDMGLMKCYLDEDASVQYVNDKALDYLGYTRQEFQKLFGNNMLAFVFPEDVPAMSDFTDELLETGRPRAFEMRAIRKDGKVIVVKGRASCVSDGHGRPVGIYAFQDVTEELERTQRLQHSLEDKIEELEKLVEAERASREALRVSEERYKLIVDQSDSIAFDWDFKTDRIEFSDKYLEMFGNEAIPGNVSKNEGIRERIHPDDMEVFEQWVKNTYRKNYSGKTEFRIMNSAGGYIWMQVSATSICDEYGRPIRSVGIFSNIDRQKREIDSLLLKSQIDPLTKLYNKEETSRRIEEYMTDHPEQPAAFFIVDVDDFKGVNDSLGHQFGDTVLRTVAKDVRDMFRDTDIVGRLGGDEIIVFMGNATDERSLTGRAEKLVQTIHNAYFGLVSKYEITGSVGISLYPKHGRTFEELYRRADIAMYKAKHRGKNCYNIYSESMQEALAEGRISPGGGEVAERRERALSTYFESDFMYNVFELLYETKDMDATVQMILELAGKRFDVDRVYVFEYDDTERITNTYEWCAPGIMPEKDSLQHISTEPFEKLLSSYDEDGLYYCEDVAALDDEAREFLDVQGIKSMLHCAISEEGRRIGIVGFDVCRSMRKWNLDEVAALSYMSRVMSVFLMRKNMREELTATHDSYVQMIENLNGYIYVVDMETFDVLYMNKAVRELGIAMGSKCYVEAFGRDTCCENCPVRRLTDEKPYDTEEIYSQVLNSWILSAASKLRWVDGREAALVCCTNISKYKDGE